MKQINFAALASAFVLTLVATAAFAAEVPSTPANDQSQKQTVTTTPLCTCDPQYKNCDSFGADHSADKNNSTNRHQR